MLKYLCGKGKGSGTKELRPLREWKLRSKDGARVRCQAGAWVIWIKLPVLQSFSFSVPYFSVLKAGQYTLHRRCSKEPGEDSHLIPAGLF